MLMNGSPVLNDIAQERQRQIDKGYDAEHDDKAQYGGLALNAAHIAVPAEVAFSFEGDCFIGEHVCAKHPRRQQLIIAAALLVAEVERLDREEERKATEDLPLKARQTAWAKEKELHPIPLPVTFLDVKCGRQGCQGDLIKDGHGHAYCNLCGDSLSRVT